VVTWEKFAAAGTQGVKAGEPMNDLRFAPLPGAAALSLLLCSCGGDLLVGEQHCYGDGVDCKSDAPTLVPYDENFDSAGFGVTVSRSVAPTWIYDHPVEYPYNAQTQLALAPGGGVWALHTALMVELQRINAQGEPVESHVIATPGTLSVDDELRPAVVVSWLGRAIRTTLGPSGEPVEWMSSQLAPGAAPMLMTNGPGGRIRLAVYERRGSYVAEYEPPDELVWKQSAVRDARDFPFEAGEPAYASYRMLVLSDGSIALGVPKKGPRELSPTPELLGLSGLGDAPERAQGITLIEPDGNLRWDIVLSEVSDTMLLAPGPDASVVYASNPSAERNATFYSPGVVFVRMIDRDGALVASWLGLRSGFHDVTPMALCSDAAGAIYAAFLTGERAAPVPTICRMNAHDAHGGVDCLGVEDVLLTATNGGLQPTVVGMVAPEPDAVVFSLAQSDAGNERAITRVVRVEFAR
jgi:hypothetical protein